MKEVSFVYKNHKGITETRTIVPEALVFESNPGYNYQPGWFLRGFCVDRQAIRSFAFVNIVLQEFGENEDQYGNHSRLTLKLEA